MRDLTLPRRPFGYFVHHQGRGHAERCAALLAALPPDRPVTIFCARDDIFPALPGHVRITRIPSLFERGGAEVDMDQVETPETLHCAPLGWPGIRQAMGTIAAWFASADPALMICDVSAEIAQLARICSVPHVKILQHGARDDAGHQAAYAGAAGLLAPFAAELAQPDWQAFAHKIHFAPGLGVTASRAGDRATARRALSLDPDRPVALILSGAGGTGFSQAPLGVAARAFPGWTWLTIGKLQEEWHATEGRNLVSKGWVDDPETHVAAADLVISSTGNTTCAQVLTAGRPWIVVPEWRYFDEQRLKAEALDRAGAALHLPHLPSSAQAWRAAVTQAMARHDPARQARLISADPAAAAARWLETLSDDLWGAEPLPLHPVQGAHA
ncbi:UDP-N-acetylglucosamine--N-acetylmuramyl-(pentapeptide) pyrophosphoryl-undecaprenol N-acetylglucosamine transferase [Paracoccus liaowanqingii]|uniref:UDP-N-acetylglucosamine--N-acetylmuramyl-(Pentapeptide) pyrophosphoryl-undecaprenol N-acetylglucosamine transferase n=1 Tax=Paracoccus liaowanqingii TaxID=2560053 RepID=A0A4P7HLF1_9RHOB|nr:glycosyltransferase [Paracoccus liaowanqingii]QBX34985.1 UDP-N-acetylglucosamine--N-acetylmuramyl-(pentapeptide) pyrophosphoryl-undecaprenol N-acetylglucosamine transferase [Paracoccus liaowanqingii]